MATENCEKILQNMLKGKGINISSISRTSEIFFITYWDETFNVTRVNIEDFLEDSLLKNNLDEFQIKAFKSKCAHLF